MRFGGGGLSGVTVTLAEVTAGSGAGATQSTTTDISGHYCFSALSDRVYRITPRKPGYAFAPARGRAKLAGAKVARRNFTATLSGCFATGKVTHGASGLGGVIINLTGAETWTTTTRSEGSYSFAALAEGEYTVTPTSGAGYTFLPENRSFKIGGAAVTGLDFAVAVGSLTVTLTPERAIAEGARWKVGMGFSRKSGVTVANLPAVPHTVTFKALRDWTTPPTQTVTIVAGETARVTGTYQSLDAGFAGTPTSGKTSLKAGFTH